MLHNYTNKVLVAFSPDDFNNKNFKIIYLMIDWNFECWGFDVVVAGLESRHQRLK